MILCILGRQPNISLAELEAKFGNPAIKRISNSVANIDINEVKIDDFGGLMKLAKLAKEGLRNDQELLTTLLDLLPKNHNGKITVGISWYGAERSAKAAFAFALELKKLARQQCGLSLRIVPNKTLELSTAQVTHNQLTVAPNFEFLIVEAEKTFSIGQTIGIQDIERYGQRDHGRPARDARVGMLPPKLAQIMLNLALGQSTAELGSDSQPINPVILDCFCGTGVVLQEALLLGYKAVGTDLEPRMVTMAKTNLEWLGQNFSITPSNWQLEVGDARKAQWQPPIDAVVSEIYLGPPISNVPQPNKLKIIKSEVDNLLDATLKNLASQLPSGTPLCLAVPAWRLDGQRLEHLSSIDRLEELGYTRASFKQADNKDLVYFRPDQIVARELLVLIRK